MMKTRHIAIAALTAALSIPGAMQAQNSGNGTLRGTVNVDGRYLPDVIRQERVTMLPTTYAYKLEAMELTYENRGVLSDFDPSFTPLPAPGWRDSRTVPTSRGYLDIATGSWLDANISAGYRFIDDDNTTLGFMLQHNSTTLWKPDMSPATRDTRRHLYDQTLGIYFSHSFEGIGSLDARLDYRLAAFNYYGFYDAQAQEAGIEGFKPADAPCQTINDVYGRVGWTSPRDNAFRWDAALDARYFGFRSLYLSQPGPLWQIDRFSGLRETDIAAEGTVCFDTSESSALRLGVRAEGVGYSDPQCALVNLDSYGNIRLRPAYTMTRGNMNIRVGAELNLTFNAGPEESRFSAFHIAPDVRFDFKAYPVAFYLHIGGGVRLNTLASQQAEDYYCMPTLTTTRPLNTPIEARLGVNTSRFGGFSAGASIAYRVSKNQPLGGWYTRYLNYPLPASPTADPATQVDYFDNHGIEIKGWSLAAFADYTLGRKFSLRGDVAYQMQNGYKGFYNGLDRPRWVASLSASVRPAEPLSLTLKYEYRGVRNIYLGTFTPYGAGVTLNGEPGEYSFTGYRLPDITDLSLHATYELNPSVTLMARADNLFARKIEVLPDVKSQGLTLLAGIQVLF